MAKGTPWRYLYTVALTDLGKSEEWFWDVSPKVLMTMIEEHKRNTKEKMKAQAYFINGGTEDIDEEVAGIDFPASESSMAFLGG